MKPHSPSCEVLSAGYSYHSKPFHVASRRGLRSYLIRFQVEGCCRMLVNGEIEKITPGDLLLFKPGDRYELKIEEEVQHDGKVEISSGDYYFFCRGPWVDEWWSRAPKPQRLKMPLSEHLLHLCRQAILEQRKGKGFGKEIAEYYLRILCLSIERSIQEQRISSGKGKSFLAYEMKNYIEENALSAIRVKDVAEHAGISVSRAVHLFKSTFGQTIMQYAMQIRLSVARERILFSKMSLEQIAETCGFNSYTYFYRVFRARYGMSPKEYRSEEHRWMD
jgi:AraC family transcriptional regulator of arabinose operon